MTLVVTANIAGQTRGEPVRLPDRRRRRLSTIVARHKPPAGRRFIVSVHRKGETFLRPTDGSVRLRAKWSRTLVGPDDVVLVTEVPLGRGIASIGLAIASIALIAVAPYAAPGLAAGLGLGTSAAAIGAVQAGSAIGEIALSTIANCLRKIRQEGPATDDRTELLRDAERRPLRYRRRGLSDGRVALRAKSEGRNPRAPSGSHRRAWTDRACSDRRCERGPAIPHLR
ncbi:hypothetical protein [Methylorubrum populi]|uniref:Uncharacterized protein n=1 Tax=Methylorubrum populi TaxID=223967 RepID=A0A833J0Q3_9HYPH|nr:hypothetical protein [Methylorubrum populi]KAB7782287.1 hypothetical protein F8B43_5042 [Methylorubrum populi]